VIEASADKMEGVLGGKDARRALGRYPYDLFEPRPQRS
jgi:hypothetical protein